MRLMLPLLAILATPAGACALPQRFALAHVAHGPVVVVANVTAYRLNGGEGLLMLDVSEVWKGIAPDHLTVRWQVKLAEPPPDTWDRSRAVIAALSPTGQGFDLVVEICGSAWLVPDTPETRSIIRAALSR